MLAIAVTFYLSEWMRYGFSLVELSIVLVILGLLTGGILAGQSLIRASELRAVTTEHQRWVTATHAFRDKYFQLPGDFSNAQDFWGVASSGCNNNSGLSSTGVCNGNGDNRITWCSGASAYACKEVFWFWQHLGLAGLIEGKYTGYGTVNPTTSARLVNVPASKLSSTAFWTVDNINRQGIGDNNWISKDYGNYLATSRQLKPEESWMIDSKADDGMPAQGKVWGVGGGGAVGNAYGAGECTTMSNSNNFTGTYRLDLSDKVCALFFVQQF